MMNVINQFLGFFEFTHVAWIWAVITVAVVSVIVLSVLHNAKLKAEAHNEQHHHKQKHIHTKRCVLGYTLTWSAFVLVVCMFVGSFVMLLHDWTTNDDRHLNVPEVANEFGIAPDTVYPFALGSRFAGTSGSGSMQSHFFTTSGSFKVSPSTGMSIGFQDDNSDKSYILEVPTSLITFEQRKDVEPTVQLIFNKDQYLDDTTRIVTYDSEHYALRNFLLRYNKLDSVGTNMMSDRINQGGLSMVVSQYVRGVRITLTPEQYQQILEG